MITRLFLNSDGKHSLFETLSRKERRKLAETAKVIGKEYGRIMTSLSTSGAGYQNDKLLRQLSIEYTNRYASSGVHTKPVSFNYFEPFCDIKLIEKSAAPYAYTVNEVDHLFSISDFFDFATCADGDGFSPEQLMDLPEAKTLHYTPAGSLNDFSLLNADGREFLIAGFSIIRRGAPFIGILLAASFFLMTSGLR